MGTAMSIDGEVTAVTSKVEQVAPTEETNGQTNGDKDPAVIKTKEEDSKDANMAIAETTIKDEGAALEAKGAPSLAAEAASAQQDSEVGKTTVVDSVDVSKAKDSEVQSSEQKCGDQNVVAADA